LPWSINFIKRYENLWNWELLAQNENVMGNTEIRNYFYNRLYPYFEDYLESSTHMFNGLNGSEQTYSEEIEMDSTSFFKKHKELQFQHPDEIANVKSIDWLRLSQNEILP